ncbi:MAG: 2-oxoglutarate-dependent dioxygenase [Burkholderiaceae bacterium]|jgi:prolyl 4-hydroxylase|nr:MAG: 2-oxoglutarate-dependent dioxygenase [Burkholderiaceae bacterium]
MALRQNLPMSAVQQTQAVTPELRAWIIEQAQAGAQPEAVLASMKASGWNEDVAIAALEETLRGFLDERAKSSALLPPPVPVPDPLPKEGGLPTVLRLPDREVRVVMAMNEPRVVVLGGLLSHEECDELIAQAERRLTRSETVQTDTGASEVNAARTSQGMFFERGESELCRRIEARIAALIGWPVDNGEGIQVLRYRPGAEYKPHYDYFDPAQPGTPRILERGGQRVATVVMYLNDPEIGGGTTFPDVKVEVAPVKGNAVFFSYERAHPSSKTLHGGAPVVAGEKWVATKWLREGVFR